LCTAELPDVWDKALKGDAESQAKVGHFYSTAGEHVEAASWTQKAAQQGDLMARANLATMYADGRGVLRDHAAAYTWLLGIRNDVCAFDLESWKVYENASTNIAGLAELRHREATKLSAEEKAEAERRAATLDPS
jgi:TPR repeat protein